MTVVILPVNAETSRIADLLDRLDPHPSACTVPGCLHVYGTRHDHDMPVAA